MKKYPRTKHLPNSLSVTDDDKMHKDYSTFEGRQVVVTEKLDGENVKLYRDTLHTRSMDRKPTSSHTVSTWAKVNYLIPEGWALCCEDLTYVHSVSYKDLGTYLYVFGVLNEQNEFLAWNEVIECVDNINTQVGEIVLKTPVVLYEGIFNIEAIHSNWLKLQHTSEGYVVRHYDSFSESTFSESVGKFVRECHVQPDAKHWRYTKKSFNIL